MWEKKKRGKKTFAVTRWTFLIVHIARPFDELFRVIVLSSSPDSGIYKSARPKPIPFVALVLPRKKKRKNTPPRCFQFTSWTAIKAHDNEFRVGIIYMSDLGKQWRLEITFSTSTSAAKTRRNFEFFGRHSRWTLTKKSRANGTCNQNCRVACWGSVFERA